MATLLAAPTTFSWNVASGANAGVFELYRQGMAELYEVTDVCPRVVADFTNTSSMTLFNAGAIGRGRSAAQTLSRTASQIRRSNIDSISVILNLAGIRGDCDGVDVRTASGAVQFRDLGLPSASRIDAVDLVNLTVPRELAPSWMRDRAIHGLALEPGSAVSRLLASHLSTLADVASGLTHAEGAAAIEAAFLIAGQAMGRQGRPSALQAEALHRTVRVRASRIMERRLLDPGLTPDVIALEAGTSRSALYRAFADQGGVLKRIQNLRLDRARGALQRRVGRHPSVADIASQHGFASESHFCRVFKARFGHSPGEAPPPSGFAPAGQGVTGDFRYDLWFDWMRDGRLPGGAASSGRASG